MKKRILTNAFDEAEVYNNFAIDLAHGVDVVDRNTYDIIIDSRRKNLLTHWLEGKKGLFLDYGCGDGSFSRFIQKDMAADVIGVDISGGLTKYALSKGKDVSYLVADCHALPFQDKSFDTILSIGILHHLNLQKAISECQRLLKKDGFLIAFEPNLLCPISFIGRKLSKTKIHTPQERPLTLWSFIGEARKKGMKTVEFQFLSFFGFIFPFIWESKFARPFAFLKQYAKVFQIIDRLFENIPIIKNLCWQFGCKCAF